jgi:hypothetical protein
MQRFEKSNCAECTEMEIALKLPPKRGYTVQVADFYGIGYDTR